MYTARDRKSLPHHHLAMGLRAKSSTRVSFAATII